MTKSLLSAFILAVLTLQSAEAISPKDSVNLDAKRDVAAKSGFRAGNLQGEP